jgi:hypothetical protein
VNEKLTKEKDPYLGQENCCEWSLQTAAPLPERFSARVTVIKAIKLSNFSPLASYNHE